MRKGFLFFTVMLVNLLLVGCGVYSFSGSTLPGHLSSVDLPLFANATLEPELAEALTEELNREILRTNLLRIVSENGDATISGTVTDYSNKPHSFGAPQEREVDIEQYRVLISAEVSFFDNRRDEALFEGVVTGEGIYDFQTETEEHGKQAAIEEIIEEIMQNSVQSW